MRSINHERNVDVFLSCLAVFAILVLPLAYADDQYKPYLHKPEVPKHPTLKLYGAYSTNLFPGAATYSYPLDVPKGTNGLQPSLVLSYNSQAMKGSPSLFGAGWSITQSYVYRDVNSTVAVTSDDELKLVLNGASYDLVYNSADGSYHTKIESYLKVQKINGGSNTYGEYWLVTAKDGTRHRFGYNSDSELVSNTGQNYTLRWSLDLTTDTHNNKVYYVYREDPYAEDIGTVYPYQIIYNNDQMRKVEFVLENSTRPDYRKVYDGGNLLNISRRIKDINIYAENTLVRRYSFEYANLSSEASSSSLYKIRYSGADDTSILHQVTFGYYSPTNTNTKYNTTTWIPPTSFSSNTVADSGARLADLNNDGFIDILKAQTSAGLKQSWLNTKTGWTTASAWNSPVYFVDASNVDNGVRLLDLNQDGFTDIIQGNGATKDAWLNTGSGWTNASAVWDAPTSFISSGLDTGAQLADLNGDGRLDIIEAKSGGNNKSWVNNGNGWTETTSTRVAPVNFIDASGDTGARVVDVNGDGLDDVIQSSNKTSSVKKAWLNTGAGWLYSSVWEPPIAFTTAGKVDAGVRIVDMDGDGLPDLVEDYYNLTFDNTTNQSVPVYTYSSWLNNGHGWTFNSSWGSPENFTKDGNNVGRRLADVNGDGYADVVVAYTDGAVNYNYTWVRDKTYPYMLESITNEYGGTTILDYQNSTHFNNTGNDGLSDIGFNIWVVKEVLQNNSMNNTFNTVADYNYTFFGGKYNYTDKEFRGFNIVNETKSGSVTSHYFHQDSAMKGKEYRTEVYGSNSSLFSRIENVWSYSTTNGMYTVHVDSQATYSYDGSTTPEVTNTTYSYDQYSNVVTRNEYGGVNNPDDDRYSTYSYAYNVDDWIIGKVAKHTLMDEDQEKISETAYLYDGYALGAVSKGDLTSVERWLDGEQNPTTRYEYDGYGNVIKKTDALGYSTTHQYGLRDTTHTYADRTINAKGHITDYNYDLGTGNLLWQEKNNIRTSYEYDTFGRVLKEILPYDSSTVPTKSYEYSLDGVAPEKVKVSVKTIANGTIDVYYFYDGFSNLVQMKRNAEGEEQVVKNVYYDGSFRPVAEDNPYLATTSDELTAPSSRPQTNFTYDALDRVVLVRNPDGTYKNTTFDRRTITDYDENVHYHQYILDGYGRIKNVLEQNDEPLLGNNLSVVYNTTYEYDTLDNLVRITDDEGNTFNFTYDTLGRKTAISDPDLGRWSYEYDLYSNLVKQTDAVGNEVSMSYDSLSRVLTKNSSTDSIRFSYDVQYDGTLSNYSMDNVSYRFNYDQRLRPVSKEVFVAETWFNQTSMYDSGDRLIRQDDFDGMDFRYNEQGLLDKITGYVTNIDYDAFDSPKEVEYQNSLVTTYTYDDNNHRLTKIWTIPWQKLEYEYDNVGNVLKINDSINSRIQLMTYDYLDRLVTAKINGVNYTYEYDSLGRIRNSLKDGIARRYTYDGAPAHAPSSIATEEPGMAVRDYAELGNTKNRTFEFFLASENNESLIEPNWSMSLGDGSTINSTLPFNLSEGGNIYVIVQHEYSFGGDYDIDVYGIASSNSTNSKDLPVKFGVRTTDLERTYGNGSQNAFNLSISNDLDQNLSSPINWTCNNSVDGQEAFYLGPLETVKSVVESIFTTAGKKSLLCRAISADGTESITLDFRVHGLEIENYALHDVNTTDKVFEFRLHNYWDSTVPADWTISNLNITSTEQSDLAPGQEVFVIVGLNYSDDGDKQLLLNANATNLTDTKTTSFKVKSLEIQDYNLRENNATDKVISFNVFNYWPETQSVNWNISDPTISSDESVDIPYNDRIFYVIAVNYSEQGTQQPTLYAYSPSFADSYTDTFTNRMIEVTQFSILRESQSDTISEAWLRNNIENRNLSWSYFTGEQMINSANLTQLNTSESVYVIIGSNYTNVTAYKTNFTINSTGSPLYTDEKQGVVSI